MMRIVAATIVFLILSLNPCPARTEGFPLISDCEALTLRTSQGWWLSVRPDGSGAYGFGTLVDRVEIKQRSFDFGKISESVKTEVVEQKIDADAPYIEVSCHMKNGDDRVLYLLSQALIVDLFRTARMNEIKPRNKTEEQWHNKISDLWKRDPLFSHEK